MIPRFHVPGLSATASSVRLGPDESHHLVRVMRIPLGATVHVFDGQGGEWAGIVWAIDRQGVTIGELRPVPPVPLPAVALTLMVAVVRGAAMDNIIRDATALGVRSIVPVLSRHVSVPHRHEARRAALSHWQRVAVAACKQCGRAHLPDVGAPRPLGDAVRGLRTPVRLLLAEPGLQAPAVQRLEPLREAACRGGATLLVGPEGGWADEDLRLALEAGFLAWTLGSSTLRADLAPAVALAIALYAWQPNATPARTAVATTEPVR